VVWSINFIFPYIGKNHPNWLIFFRGTNILQRGWNHQPVYTLCVDQFIPCESHSHKQRLTLFRPGLPHRLLKLNEINSSTFLCFHLQSKTSIWNYHSSETHISSYIIYPYIYPMNIPSLSNLSIRYLGVLYPTYATYATKKPRGLRASSLLSLPSDAEMAEMAPEKLPCLAYPSDHMALGVQLSYESG